MLLVAALALLAAVVLAQVATADDGASWGIRPADGVHGAARDNFRYTASPGDVVEDVLVVTNHGGSPLTVRVGVSDGELAADGLVELAPVGADPTGLATWVDVAVESLELAPGEVAEVPFAIRVPEAAQPGPVAGAVVTSSLTEGAESGVAVDRRLAASVVVDVREHTVEEGRGVPLWALLAVVGLALAAAATWRVVLRGRATS